MENSFLRKDQIVPFEMFKIVLPMKLSFLYYWIFGFNWGKTQTLRFLSQVSVCCITTGYVFFYWIISCIILHALLYYIHVFYRDNYAVLWTRTTSIFWGSRRFVISIDNFRARTLLCRNSIGKSLYTARSWRHKDFVCRKSNWFSIFSKSKTFVAL